ncbi:MAG: dihydrofolate reductase family protein [Candidatus Sericytochromatia bacterium]
MSDKPYTTLFMLISLDGKISTGITDNFDVDKDFPKITGVKEGLYQYYELEQNTDLFSLNSGKVLCKVGANLIKTQINKLPVSYLIIDNKPHLNDIGVDNYLKKSEKLFIITTNQEHPAFKRKNEKNLELIFYNKKIDFKNLFFKLKNTYKIEKLTIQTGGTLNAIFLREKLIDKISVVMAPILIGGGKTASLIDGNDNQEFNDLFNLKALKLLNIRQLDNSYIHLEYEVLNDTKIE